MPSSSARRSTRYGGERGSGGRGRGGRRRGGAGDGRAAPSSSSARSCVTAVSAAAASGEEAGGDEVGRTGARPRRRARTRRRGWIRRAHTSADPRGLRPSDHTRTWLRAIDMCTVTASLQPVGSHRQSPPARELGGARGVGAAAGGHPPGQGMGGGGGHGLRLRVDDKATTASSWRTSSVIDREPWSTVVNLCMIELRNSADEYNETKMQLRMLPIGTRSGEPAHGKIEHGGSNGAVSETVGFGRRIGFK
ncbi:hypothetical protein GGX14DRAFT_617933 [Mycena pura]|uniref:Uncharacterized protein n=1 Tax=Mycena pura TaxID=153505 RepID=A0AAD6YFE7_9AGAR|nr:hypothetical protein GGX14DRAFT_617933 [Mycena pura]